MTSWLSKHWPSVIALVFGLSILFYGQGCESKVPSLLDPSRKITRSVLDLELKQLLALSVLRKVSLDRQDSLKRIIAENAIILIEGSPTNPLGILSGILGLYGLAQGSKNIKTAIKNGIAKKKTPEKNA